MNDFERQPSPDDPREAGVETAQDVDPKTGRSDDPRVDPTPGTGPSEDEAATR